MHEIIWYEVKLCYFPLVHLFSPSSSYLSICPHCVGHLTTAACAQKALCPLDSAYAMVWAWTAGLRRSLA